MANNQKINEAIIELDEIVKKLSNIKNIFLDLDTEPETETGPESESPVPKKPEVQALVKNQAESIEDFGDFESLKKALFSDKWPEAVNPNLICSPDSESDKLERGRGIIELMIEEDIKDLKVLDFGCGEGQCTFVASEYEPKLAVGYDVKPSDKWATYKNDKTLYTTNFDEVLLNGPYDVIILFDVIDHAKEEGAISILKKAKQALASNGKIYMRCHPFISRHGTHLYHDLNKAYIHLVFTPEELQKIVSNSKFAEDSIGVTAPINTYQNFIESASLKISTRRDITSKVEPFFKIPKIADRIIKSTKFTHLPEFQMGMDFLDYVLTH